MCRCMICGTEHKEDFTIYKKRFLCDECMSILDYYYKQARVEISDRYEEVNNAEMWECEFLEGLDEFVTYKTDEYNEGRKKHDGKISRENSRHYMGEVGK